uniref:Uncharacterized protein n=1 Tax=Rhizophora mucronata TaxID=61149 RepID=A0A2P2QDX7_RHIMU
MVQINWILRLFWVVSHLFPIIDNRTYGVSSM